MNLLTIYPIQSCNLSCPDCPNKTWTYPVDSPLNALNNDLIFRWFDKYIDPHNWFIDISGGEPGVYPEITELMYGLEERGYYGIVRTNGTLPIPKVKRFIRLAAWHLNLEFPPKYYDMILILRKNKSMWKEKVKYCIFNNIPYREIAYNNYDAQGRITNSESFTPMLRLKDDQIFENWSVVYSSGNIAKCQSPGSEIILDGVQEMISPPLQKLDGACKQCSLIEVPRIVFTNKLLSIVRSHEYQ